MLSMASFLPFLICCWSAMPVEPWLQKPLCQKKKISGCWSCKDCGWYKHCCYFLNESLGSKQLCLQNKDLLFSLYLVVNLIRYKHEFSYCCSHEGRACSEVILWDEFAQCISSRRKLKALLAHCQYCLQNTEWMLKSNYHWARVYVWLRKLLGMTGVWNLIFEEVCKIIYGTNNHKLRRNGGDYTSC